MLVFKDLRTDEHFYFLHQEGSFYVMNGCQKLGTHEKLGGTLRSPFFCHTWPQLKNPTKDSHVSVIFRSLKPTPLSSVKSIFAPVPVVWCHNKAICDFKAQQMLPYQGLNVDEPIGFVWRSRVLMLKMAAHHSLISGIHSVNSIVYSIVDNGDTQNKHFGTFSVYCGHGAKDIYLEKSNKALASTATQKIPFRFYVGSKSIHKDRPEIGFKLVGLVYITSFKLVMYQRIQAKANGLLKLAQRRKLRVNSKPKSQNLRYQWTFHLSLIAPTEIQSRTMLSKFKNNSRE